MPQGDIVERAVVEAELNGAEEGVEPEHDAALTAHLCPFEADVAEEDCGGLGVKLLQRLLHPEAHRQAEAPLDLLPLQRPDLVVRQRPVERDPGKGDDLKLPLAQGDEKAPNFPGDVDTRDAERLVDIDRGGARLGYRQVVVADEQHSGDAGFGQAADPLGEGTLQSGVGVTVLEGIASEEHGVHTLGHRVVDHRVEDAQEVLHAGGETGCRVGAAVQLDAQVKVGEVDEAERGHESSPISSLSSARAASSPARASFNSVSRW
ncbi:hypothetical protein HRbin26_02306 [bacterium HR26]|nr:hypothetical protein HRbin26_02306 [bacterium HR26]